MISIKSHSTTSCLPAEFSLIVCRLLTAMDFIETRFRKLNAMSSSRQLAAIMFTDIVGYAT